MYLAGRMTDADYDRDRVYFERDITSLDDEIRRMKSAADERLRHSQQLEDVASLSKQWMAIREVLTEEEKREIIWALVTDVSISPDDELTIEGTLKPFSLSLRNARVSMPLGASRRGI